MRLSNESDQALVRSAVSDATQNLLSFVPSLGPREVFTFGTGIALPSRMRFQELPAAMRPNSEATGSTRSDAGASISRDMILSVIDRWRGASGYKTGPETDFTELETAPRVAVAPSPPLAPTRPSVPAADPMRHGLLKKPLDVAASGQPSAPPGYARPR